MDSHRAVGRKLKGVLYLSLKCQALLYFPPPVYVSGVICEQPGGPHGRQQVREQVLRYLSSRSWLWPAWSAQGLERGPKATE